MTSADDGDAGRRARAVRRVRSIKGFYSHGAIFALVMTILAVVDVATGSPYWVQWPLLGWGAGIIVHGLIVYGRIPLALSDWERRKVEQMIEQDRHI